MSRNALLLAAALMAMLAGPVAAAPVDSAPVAKTAAPADGGYGAVGEGWG